MSLRDRITALFAPKQQASLPSPGVPYTDSVWDRTLVRSGEKATAAQLVSWLKEAEAGETGHLHAFYDEMRARIPDLEVEVGKAESRLAGGRIKFLPWPQSLRSRTTEPSGEAALAAEIAAYVRDVCTAPDVRLDKAIVALSQGFWKGLGAVAPVIVPDPVDPKREKILSLRPIPSQRFRYETDSTKLLLQTGEDRDDVVDVEPLVASGDLILLQSDESIPSPARRGLFRRIYVLALGLLFGPGWWTRFVELYGIPLRVGHHPRGDEEGRMQLIEGLRSMGAEAFAALPEGAKLEILDSAARSGSSDVHQAFAEWAARTIAKLVNGASQTTDIQQGSGSRASAGVHENVADERHRDRAREVAAVLRSGLASGLVARRWGWAIAQKHTPEVVIDVDAMPDLLDLATAMKTFREAGAGDAIPLSIVHDRTTIPPPEKGEATLGALQPPPVPGKPGEEPEEEDEKAKPKPGAKGKPEETEEEAAAGPRRRSPEAELAALERFADRQAALFGYELIEPVRRIVEEAEREGWSLEQTFAAVMERMDIPPDSPKLIDALAAVQLEGVMRGLVSERDRVRIS